MLKKMDIFQLQGGGFSKKSEFSNIFFNPSLIQANMIRMRPFSLFCHKKLNSMSRPQNLFQPQFTDQSNPCLRYITGTSRNRVLGWGFVQKCVWTLFKQTYSLRFYCRTHSCMYDTLLGLGWAVGKSDFRENPKCHLEVNSLNLCSLCGVGPNGRLYNSL